jgi:hypothetical protein
MWWKFSGLCFGTMIALALALEAALHVPLPVGLIIFAALNIAAVHIAWSALLERLMESG